MTAEQLRRRLASVAAARYRQAGRFAYFFARGKLSGDPVFTALLAGGLIPDNARILDLGCGQGLLAAWIEAARECHLAGEWLDSWPAPPRPKSIRGIELMGADVDRARRALGPLASVEVGDIRDADFGQVEVIVILDVLHYMDWSAQEVVLQRARAAIGGAGKLLLRVGDAGGGLRFNISRWVDAAVLRFRGHGALELFCRSLPEWRAALARAGFNSDAMRMSTGTPFANVLLVATPK